MQICLLIFLFLSYAYGNDDALDRGPVLPEAEKIVKEIEKLSCVNSLRIKAEPYSECEKLRLSLRGVFATIKRDTDAFQEANQKLARVLSSGTDIDQGAQCGVAQLLDETYANITAQENKIRRNIYFSKKLHEGLGAKPWESLVAFRANLKEVYRFAECTGTPRMSASHCQASFPEGGGNFLRMRNVFQGANANDFLKNGAVKPLVSRADAELRAISEASGKTASYLTKSQKKAQELKTKLQERRALIAAKYTCVQEKKDLVNKVKLSSVAIDLPEKKESGTGFYVKTIGPDGKEQYSFVTAHHVPAANPEDPMNLKLEPANTMPSPELERRGAHLKTPTSSETFAVEPGRFDRGNDIVTREVPPRANALSVIEAGRTPEMGQAFYLSGHPGYAGGEFTSHTCRFAGYGASYSGDGTAYYMDCPSSVTHQGGLSGGSMVDKEGKVWGLASSHGGRDSVIRVTPIGSDSQGHLVFGAQKIFVSDFCRTTVSSVYFRCQIIPGEAY